MPHTKKNLIQNELQVTLFPKEIIEFSAETYLNRIRVRSQAIYSTIIAVVIIVFATLPFVHVPISLQSKGLIRTEEANSALVSPVSGKIVELYSKENDAINKADQIALLESPHLTLRENYLTGKRSALGGEEGDLEHLISAGISSGLGSYVFRTDLYQSEYMQFRREFVELNEQVEFDKDQLDVSKSMLVRGIVTQADTTRLERDYKQAYNRLSISIEERRKRWETELHSVRQQIEQLNHDLLQVENDRQQFRLNAPTGGVVQQIENLSIGTFVSAGQTLAMISPRENPVAEIFVSTRDIGLISIDTPVVLQIDAFNHLEWGQVGARITEISKDVYLINGVPRFRILCDMDKHSLSLKNGAVGRLKKGLTFTARFEIANRTLFQLLRDQLDDWFSPYGMAEGPESED
jgi:multidrug resistance efflux pump